MKRATRLIFYAVVLTILEIVGGPGNVARAQGSKADYERANSLAARTEGKVFRQRVQAHWIPDAPRFWYSIETGPRQLEYWLVNAEIGERRPLFDRNRLSSRLRSEDATTPETLKLQQLQFDGQLIHFKSGEKHWAYDPSLDQLTPEVVTVSTKALKPLEDGPQRSRRSGESTEVTFVNQTSQDVELYWLDEQGDRHSYGRVRAGAERVQHSYLGHVWLITDRVGTALGVWEVNADESRAVIAEAPKPSPDVHPPAPKPTPAPIPGRSPDGQWQATMVDRHVEIRPAGDGGSLAFQGGNCASNEIYAPAFSWSPDSTRVVARRIRPVAEHRVHFVEAAPRDQLQPKLHSHLYFKPGDPLPKPQLVLINVTNKTEHLIDDALYPNPFTEDGDLEVNWWPDGRAFRFSYNQRGHQIYRLLSVDGHTGGVRVVVEESAKTYVDWTAKTWRQWLDASAELLWMSERDGWCHLYLYDSATGQLKNPVTRGEWVVRKVENVDEARRQIWFYAGGIRPAQDPYQLHFCRVNFDGSGLTILTEGDGQHQVEFSPDRRWFVDTWSRVDQPPVSELRRSLDGGLVCELERADISALLATGWTLPERFSAKARDGKTDIHGIIIRPTNLEKNRQYPVLEEVYAGPQAAYVPKDFSRLLRAHAFAELGFIVVQVDGLGTSQRSKAIQDYCYKNLADAGFVDRIGWIRAAAASRPWMDLSRVGIYGGSAGGQNAMRALLDHADFYSAAVADCGCHDNRMDKIWWNEQWLGWPVDDSYVRSSNVADAHKLRGHLMLIVGEVDTNVDPASTLQVVHALEKADKDFELLIMTGSNHGAGETPYASRRRQDFFVRHLLNKTPRWE